MSSPRHSGTASIDRIWPPMIDSLVDSSSCAFAVSTAARSASTRRSTRATRAHRIRSVRERRRGIGALARHRERESILVVLGAQQDRDVGRARQQLERRRDDRLDHLAGLEPRAERLQRLVDAQRLGRLAIELIGDLRQVHDRARRDQAIAGVVFGLVADPHRDPDRIVAVAEQQGVAVDERDLPARARVDRDALAVALDRRAVRRAQIAKHVVLADLRDLRVIARQVIVGDHDRARGRTPDRQRSRR